MSVLFIFGFVPNNTVVFSGVFSTRLHSMLVFSYLVLQYVTMGLVIILS